MKKNDEVKKSRKIHAEKKAARKPRLTKEEREARKLKLQEERAAKKAARLAKREAKKQKEVEKKAAAKAKREERKAKKAARLLKEKERKAALKLKAKERAEKKRAALLAKKSKGKIKKAANDTPSAPKLSAKEKIEAERNEWKTLSAVRRYVKNNAKILEELDGDKLERKLKKLEKMGYEVLRGPDGKLLRVGYNFEVGLRIKVAKPEKEKKEEEDEKVEEPKTEADEVQQPQKNEEEEEPELLTDAEILNAAEEDGKTDAGSEVLVGDSFADEGEVAAKAEELGTGSIETEDDDDEEDDVEDDEEDDILGGGDGISNEQAAYRREAFQEMEGNGAWD